MKAINEMSIEERELYSEIVCAISAKNLYEESAYEQMRHVEWEYEELSRTLDCADGSGVDWGAVATDAANLASQLTWLIKEAMNAEHMCADYRALSRDHAAEVKEMEAHLAK